MFTGIVQGKGRLVAIANQSIYFCSYIIELNDDMIKDLEIGASIANNGCCLTVTHIDGNCVSFDVMAETLARTNLSELKIGSEVNIERAARFSDEIGGHIMSGHIMCQTPILRIERTDKNCTLWLALPIMIKNYVLTKGFIGLDGCSLTVGEVRECEFCVHLIPETLQRTVFATRQIGDNINVEIDAQTQAIVDTVQRILDNR